MHRFINGRCIQCVSSCILNVKQFDHCKNIFRPSSLIQINRSYKRLFLSQFKEYETKSSLAFIKLCTSKNYRPNSVQNDKNIVWSSTFSKLSRRCIVKHNKGNSKVSLIGNIESSEKALSSYDAPLVHHASSGFVVDLQRSFLNSKLKTENSSTGSLDVVLNELELLTQIKPSYFRSVAFTEKGLKEDIKVTDHSPFPKFPESRVNYKPTSEVILRNKSFFANLPKYYASLAKSRLTGLVVLTSMAGYAIAPAPFVPAIFLACSLGTALMSSSANSINQIFEVSYDSQMSRTKNRVLVRGLLSPLHAISFGAVCGGTGIAILYFGVNELTAVLGALNLIIYSSIYTPLKQMSIVNTWVGSVVGAIPPMMGWAGCTGSLSAGAFIIGGILYAWQFPHFNSLSWNIKHDYAKAGYKMMAISHPELCRRTALKYSASLIVLSTLAPVFDITTWTFAVESLPLNLYFTYLAWRFYKEADSSSSRRLFRYSLLHLPALLLLMYMSKKDLVENEPSSKSSLSDNCLPALSNPS